MKRTEIVFCLIFCMILSIFPSVYAANEATINFDNNKFTVKVNASKVTVSIKAPNASYIYLNEAESEEPKDYSFACTLNPQKDVTGEYIVNVKFNGTTQNKKYFFANEATKATAIALVNNAKSESEVKSIIESQYQNLMLPKSTYDGLYDRILMYIPYKNSDELIKVITRENGILLLNKGDVLSTIKDYHEFFDIDISETSDFALLNKKAEEVFVALMASYKPYADVKAVQSAYKKSISYALTDNISWGHIEDIITKYNEYFALDLSGKYSSLSDSQKTLLFKEIANADVSTKEKLSDVFTRTINNITADKPDNGGGGVGGGNKGGQKSIAIGSEFTENPLPIPEAPNTDKFNDLANYAWAKDAIVYLSDKNIVSGTGNGSFEPGRSITREEFLKILMNALKLEETDESVSFRDVTEDAWYYKYVAAATKLNIVKGKSDTIFGIGEKITRQDMAVLVNRALDVCNIQLIFTKDKEEFVDENEILDYAKESIYNLQQAEIINGINGGLFGPNSAATRAEASVIVYKLLNK